METKRLLSELSDQELIPLGLIIRGIEPRKANYKDNHFAIEDSKAWIRTGMRPVMSLKECIQVIRYLESLNVDLDEHLNKKDTLL